MSLHTYYTILIRERILNHVEGIRVTYLTCIYNVQYGCLKCARIPIYFPIFIIQYKMP